MSVNKGFDTFGQIRLTGVLQNSIDNTEMACLII